MFNKKGNMWLVAVLVIIVAAGAIYYFTMMGSSEEGRIVFAITDDAANMESVTNVYLTVDKIEAHSTTEGWVDVSGNSRTYDLLEVKLPIAAELRGF